MPAAAAAGSTSSSFGRVDARLAVRRDGIDRQGARLGSRHTRYARRHSDHRDRLERRLFREQPLDDIDWDVSADRVAADERDMARRHAGGDAMLRAEGLEIRRRDDGHVETAVTHVLCIALAAGAHWILVER